MNAPINSDSPLYPFSEAGSTAAASTGYAPSVPISVYRELATELQTTRTTLNALTQQNQQLVRQNKLLRTEIERFVHAAEQLGHFAGVAPRETTEFNPNVIATESLQDPTAQPDFLTDRPGQAAHNRSAQSRPVQGRPDRAPKRIVREAAAPSGPMSVQSPDAPSDTPTASQSSAIVPHPKERKRDRPKPKKADPAQQRLFTEQPEGMRPLSQVASRADLGNLWLATTILLVVVSAFGAGFLIMRPLLSR